MGRGERKQGLSEIGCPDCGALQASPPREGPAPRNRVMTCSVCRSELERTTGRSLDAALACSAATFLLLFPANLLPFLTTSVLGVSRHSQLISSAMAMWRDGWAALGVVIALFVVVLPFARFGLLTWVLASLRSGRRARWQGSAFRWANGLQQWAMLDVFLLGLWVSYERLHSTIAVDVGVGAQCFIAAGVLTLVTRATLDKAAIWRLIGEDEAPHPRGAVSCLACNRLEAAEREGEPCGRCGLKLEAREPESVVRALALTTAGVLFYIPANIYAIATLPIGLTPTKYNVLEGVKDLAQAGLLGLALLVFTASFAIPFLKLAGLGWCLSSVLRRSPDHLRLKTRVYRIVEEIGRWSMVDPFVIACFVPVMQYNALIYGRAEPAAPFFTGVVVLTMIAARAFDPRLMWDAARPRTPRGLAPVRSAA